MERGHPHDFEKVRLHHVDLIFDSGLELKHGAHSFDKLEGWARHTVHLCAVWMALQVVHHSEEVLR